MKKKSRYDRLISYIPEGKENAISQKELRELLGCSDTELRALIQKARIDGIAVLSIPGAIGYYFSDDPTEVIPCYRMFRHRQEANKAVLRTIHKHLLSLGVRPDNIKGEKNV